MNAILDIFQLVSMIEMIELPRVISVHHAYIWAQSWHINSSFLSWLRSVLWIFSILIDRFKLLLRQFFYLFKEYSQQQKQNLWIFNLLLISETYETWTNACESDKKNIPYRLRDLRSKLENVIKLYLTENSIGKSSDVFEHKLLARPLKLFMHKFICHHIAST